MKIKITVQLDRPDGGVVDADSIAVSNPVTKEAKMPIADDAGIVMFPIKLYFSEADLAANKPVVPAVTDFTYKEINKQCTEVEWDAMNNDPDSGALVAGWMKTALEAFVGVGNCEII